VFVIESQLSCKCLSFLFLQTHMHRYFCYWASVLWLVYSSPFVQSVDTKIIKTFSELQERAKATYDQTLPCLRAAWMLEGRLATSFTKWKLPDDAEQHFAELKNLTAVFRQYPVHAYAGYKGPWLENIFIEQFFDKPLSYFNGFIPLFIQWVDAVVLDGEKGQNVDSIHKLLGTHLRSDVIYLAISQNDAGLGKIGIAHPNMLVLSAGGFGHVPLPLVKGEIDYVPLPDMENTELSSKSRNSSNAWLTDIVFIGNFVQGSRLNMLEQISMEARRARMLTKVLRRHPEWKSVMSTAMFNLAPRGFGRTSFRFAEIIQMGRVPVYLWDDVPWIPYAGTSIRIEIFGLRNLAEKYMSQRLVRRLYDLKVEKEPYHNLVKELHDLKVNKRETYSKLLQAVKEVRHFYTYKGVMEQIEHFIADPFDTRGKGTKTGTAGNYLRCIKHPRTERRALAKKRKKKEAYA